MTEELLAVECRQVSHRFGENLAVNHLDLRVERGEVVGLLGPNGAGKTTMIRLINTLLKLQDGEIKVFGCDVKTHPMDVRRRLGYVPQQLSVEGALSGRENVTLFARLYDLPRKERHQRVNEVLEMMQLSGSADQLVQTYSGGMIRRLELAQALINRPQLLVLDEPTTGLDPIARESVWDRVLAMREEYGTSVLLTTHYMEEADSLCDRIVLMHHGQLRAEGTPEALKEKRGPGATLEDVFRQYTGDSLHEQPKEAWSETRTARNTGRRLG